MPDENPPHVLDQPERRRLVIEGDGAVARLTYRVDQGRLYAIHTEVPEALRGRGLAGVLADAVTAKARREGLTLVPWCPYVRSWIERHPESVADVSVDLADTPPET